MSSFKHPVGRHSPRVYWRRRIVLLLALIAVIVVIVLLVARPGASSGATAAATATPTAAPATTATSKATAAKPAATSKSTIAPKAAATPAATSIPTSAATASGTPCTAQAIAVQPLTDAQSYAAGQQPKLSFTLTNTGTADCTIDAGTATQVFTISSGSEVYWKSTDCQQNPTHTVILLKPGKTVTSDPVIWDRTRSSPATCTVQRPEAPAGGASYHLSVSVGGFASPATAQFLLN